jgi:putative FmdB family regulatory protein
MPVYEYWCKRCEKAFTAVLHITEHDTQLPVCPACQKKDQVNRQLSTFTAVTSRKSAGY